MAKEARQRATAAASAACGKSVEVLKDSRVFYAALQQRYLLVGFPPSVEHDVVFSKMVSPCRLALFLEMQEEECVRALIDTLDVPLRDSNGAVTEENRGGYAAYRRKLAVRKRVQRKIASIIPVLHHLAAQGKLYRLHLLGGSKMKKPAIRRIMPIDPQIFDEASRLLSPVPSLRQQKPRSIRPPLATSRALTVSSDRIS